MKWLRKEKRIERGTLGPNEHYEVELMFDIYWDEGGEKEEEGISCAEMAKLEAVIESIHPGWYHTCVESPKQHCQACTRELFKKRFDKQNKR